MEKPTLIFIHIPKTGGSTLGIVLGRQFPKRVLWRFKPRHRQELIAEFKALPESRRQKYRIARAARVNRPAERSAAEVADPVPIHQRPAGHRVALDHHPVRPDFNSHAQTSTRRISDTAQLDSRCRHSTASGTGAKRLFRSVNNCEPPFLRNTL